MTTILHDHAGPVRVSFVGVQRKGSEPDSTFSSPAAAFEQISRDRGVIWAEPANVAVNQQIHSDRVVDASSAPQPADGLVTDGTTVLCVFTADCVPVLLGGRSEGRPSVAALHAGWRGLATGIISAGMSRFDQGSVTAWIGPAICTSCYQVSDDVAERVAHPSGAGVVARRDGGKPHLDLALAARLQLQRSGAFDIRLIRLCTRCNPEWFSYRREGAGQGRNHSFVWLDRSGRP